MFRPIINRNPPSQKVTHRQAKERGRKEKTAQLSNGSGTTPSAKSQCAKWHS